MSACKIVEQIEADEDVANLNYLNGKRDGIKEVVDWFKANKIRNFMHCKDPVEYLISIEEWQAKWGVD